MFDILTSYSRVVAKSHLEFLTFFVKFLCPGTS